MSLESEIKLLRLATEANTAATQSNTLALMDQPVNIPGTVELTTTEEVVTRVGDKKVTEKKTSTKGAITTKEVVANAEASKATGDDCRKVAGELIVRKSKVEFRAVLDGFGIRNITVHERDGGDFDELLAALEEAAGVKLAEIAD